MRRNSNARHPHKKEIYLATEGATGTEWHYISDLCKNNNCGLHGVKGLAKNESDPVKLVNAAIAFAKTSENNNFAFEIWVMFDNDSPMKVREAFGIINRYNKRHNPKIRIAFNSPLVEVWGILCADPRKTVSINPSKCKADLKILMPGYDHEHNRYFDLEVMSRGMPAAIAKAEKMEMSAIYEAEYDICPHAGIYKLVKSIIE